MRTGSHFLLRLEHVKLRSIFYTFATSFMGLVFTMTLLMTSKLERSSYASPYTKLRRLLANPEPQNVVIIYSQRRSGTTFMGQIFSEKPKSFYLFEPLMPFSTECDVLRKERVSSLTKILECDFRSVTNDFSEALKITGYPDDYAKCLKHTLCFSDKNGRLLGDYSNFCNLRQSRTTEEEFDPQSEDCGYPLKTSIISEICESASIVAVKTVRICSLHMLEDLYSELTGKGRRVFVLHLVRDPRAILASRLSIGLDGLNKTTSRNEAKTLCGQYRTDLKYLDKISRVTEESSSRSIRNVVTDRRYLRIRFEDMAMDPLGIARSIYRFMDSELPLEVESRISHSQYNTRDIFRLSKQRVNEKEKTEAKSILVNMLDPFGTTRDPMQVLRKWRWSLPFEIIQRTQEECEDVMINLGYNFIQSFPDLLNFSIASYSHNH